MPIARAWRVLSLLLLLVTLLACKRLFGEKRKPEGHLARVKTGNQWGYIDGNGNPVIPPSFDRVEDFEDGLAQARKGGEKAGLWGYIDSRGNWVIPARFPSTRPFAEGLAAVQDPETKRWGFIDKQGKQVVAPRFEAATSFSEGVAAVRESDKPWGYIDKNGAWAIEPRFVKADRFHSGLAAAQHNRWGHIDRSGKFVVPDNFSDVGRFSEDRAAVWTTVGGRLGTSPRTYCYYVGRDGKPVGLFGSSAQECQPFSAGLAAAAERTDRRLLWGFVDDDGDWKIKPKFRKVRKFSEKLCAAQSDENGTWGFVDFDGDWKIQPAYENADDFVDGIAPVKQKGSWGYIDKQGSWVIPAKFDDAMPMLERSARGL